MTVSKEFMREQIRRAQHEIRAAINDRELDKKIHAQNRLARLNLQLAKLETDND